MNWSTACPGWEELIRAGKPIIPKGLPDWSLRGEKALRIFKRLRVHDVLGRPTLGEVSEQWVFDLVYTIFGTADPVTRRQFIRTFFLLIAKKNGKSTLAAGIMVTALIMNERFGADFTILAPTKEIADNSFEPAMWMVKLDPLLNDVFKANQNYREIKHLETEATLKVVAADADTVGGIKSVVTLVDELWLFGKKANFENVLSEAEGALISRPEGFIMFLSTQSNDPPEGTFKRILENARKIRDGEVQDPTFLPVIYEYPRKFLKQERFWTDESLWRIPNPNLGRSVDEVFLRNKLAEAEREGPAQLNLFLAKHFNVEIGGRLRLDSWVGAQFWPRGAEKLASLDDLLERSEVVTIGIDGGGLDDLLGFAVVGRERDTGRWLIWARAWAHEIVLERRKSEAPKIMDLEKEGTLKIIGEPGDDMEDVAALVAKINATGLLPEAEAVGLDNIGIADPIARLVQPDVGLNEEQMVGIAQGFRLSGTIKTLERKLAANMVDHEGSELMSWCVGNAKTELKGNALLITKAASGTAKIDPLMAILDAAYCMALNPQAAGVVEIHAL